MNSDNRCAVIQTLIDLHAEKFGYADKKPALKVCRENTNNWSYSADFTNGNNTITLFSEADKFKSFNATFNTTVHELTHKYQYVLIELLNENQIHPDDPQYTQARIFRYGKDQYAAPGIYLHAYGFDEATAYIFYKNNPLEKVAFERGDSAENMIPELFSQQDPTAVKGEPL